MSSVHVSTESKQDYATPPELVQAIAKRFGVIFSLDLAANAENSKCDCFIPIEDDSLHQNWDELMRFYHPEPTDLDKCAWLNPPFKRNEPWMEKCARESRKGMKIISLTLSSLGSNWYRDHVEGVAQSYILRERVTFVGESQPYTKELMVTLWGFGLTGLGFWSRKEIK